MPSFLIAKLKIVRARSSDRDNLSYYSSMRYDCCLFIRICSKAAVCIPRSVHLTIFFCSDLQKIADVVLEHMIFFILESLRFFQKVSMYIQKWTRRSVCSSFTAVTVRSRIALHTVYL